MPFTAALCADTFAGARISPDSEPSLSVVRGLAGFGRWRVKVDRFREAVADLSTRQELEPEIRAEMPVLTRRLSDVLLENSVDAVLRPMVHELREGSLSSGDIGDYKAYFWRRDRAWLQSPDGRGKQEWLLGELRRRLDRSINERAREVCSRFSIPSDSLRLDLTLPPDFLLRESGPISAFLDHLSTRYMEWVIKAADSVIPVRARRWVPAAAVDWYMNLERGFKDLLAPLSRLEFDDHLANWIIEHVQAAVRDQLEERARQAEVLLI